VNKKTETMTRLDANSNKEREREGGREGDETREDNCAQLAIFSATRVPHLARKLFAERAFHCVESTRGKREGMHPIRTRFRISFLYLCPPAWHPSSSLRLSAHMCVATRVSRRVGCISLNRPGNCAFNISELFRGAHCASARFS